MSELASFLASMSEPSANPSNCLDLVPHCSPARAEVFIVRKGSTRLAAIAEAVDSTGHSLPIAIGMVSVLLHTYQLSG